MTENNRQSATSCYCPYAIVNRTRSFCVVGLLMLSGNQQLLAHEFWLQPAEYIITENSTGSVTLQNGQNFSGELLPYVPATTTQFSISDTQGTRPVAGTLGDMALNIPATNEAGLKILHYESARHQLEHEDIARFSQFAREEGAHEVLDAYLADGPHQGRVHEGYFRYAKSLVYQAQPTGADRYTGMALELVAVDNPYLIAPGDHLRLKLLHQGQPVKGTQVTIFSQLHGQAVKRNVSVTDDKGVVSIPLEKGAQFLVNAVLLRPAGLLERFLDGLHFESLWASLTFAIPG